ncbi:anti-sigma B factor antagonist [Nonomuraea solani]|uniref:Anti-sigma factor antagonist n=1 Tax=Nonomuraea solani TaxID=1144553 RepID=A0A1H6EIS1_9ACTN|nr:STAS domain-containing protein [Nonomuraea solani]SEG97732.1 anti-sigma B factor antagonist [Nonomuraea solani]
MTIIDTPPPASTVKPSTTVHLSGEINIFTSEALRTRLMDELDHSHESLVLDLSGLSFHDVSGLAVLVGVQRRARSMGITLALTAPSSRTSTMLRLTGLGRGLLIEPLPIA